ncbi:hypothetical protein AWW66_09445 [Micromonospora rosaria]|uniref:Uncharacterized protein n=1 Tax=Micromonospora rosaria TaxID=47874 RepID=A0A136PV80_9ACTN|nr:hypothetical protein [Micromonospora rosaria]KXK62247.1 hypothetical protein AWW66_09445 [Micromonospora rosaria]
MASIEQVKAALIQATEQGDVVVNQIRASLDQTEQALVRLRAVAAGSGHPAITEAIGRAEQSKQRLVEAMTLIQGSSEAARTYMGVLG